MLKIVICEDNHEYRNLLVAHINFIINQNKLKGKLLLETSSPECVLDLINTETPNVFLLDIDLKSALNGIDLAQILHEKLENIYIIFISVHNDFVFKSFKVRPFDFLPKPTSTKDIENVLIEVYKDFEKKHLESLDENIVVKIGHKIYIIPINDIIFIEKQSNKCIFHATNQTIYCYETLEKIAQKLPEDIYIRCHKSFIVNKTFINEVDLLEMKINLQNNQKCFIGKKYKDNLLNNISIR